MRCMVCGTTMKHTVGGNYDCPNCGHMAMGQLNTPLNCDIPMPQGFGENKGWICPVCGRGIAPWVDYCSCQINRNIVWATGTGTYTNPNLKEYDEYAKTNCEGFKL